MNTTKSNVIFSMTALAEASYTRFDGPEVGVTTEAKNALGESFQSTDLKGYFSASQANDFVKNWRLVAHQPNTATGFSGSVFERLNQTTGNGTGQYTLALRGTEELVLDLAVADIGQLVGNGAAFDQVIDLYNFVQRPTPGVKLFCAVPT